MILLATPPLGKDTVSARNGKKVFNLKTHRHQVMEQKIPGPVNVTGIKSNEKKSFSVKKNYFVFWSVPRPACDKSGCEIERYRESYNLLIN